MSKDNNFTYEVIEKDEENPLNDKIRKSGISVEFQMFELDHQQENYLKHLDQIRAQLNLEDAKQKNVEDNHADAVALVSELEPTKQEAIRIWLNAKKIIDEGGPARDMYEEALEEHNKEVEEIVKAIGWEPPQDAEENNETNDETEEVGESDSE